MRNLFLLPLIFLTACVTEPKVDLKTPEGLYALGKFYQEQSRYEEAINQYKALTHKHPYSSLAKEAELRVADCYYEKEDFPEAFNSYKLFKELHPRYRDLDYVIYRAAESLHKELPGTVDRDLTKARQAISFYEELVNQYPQSKHFKESREKREALVQMLADKELYIADFYYQQEKYLSSYVRYEMFIQEFPQNKKTPHALLYGARAAQKIPDEKKLSLFKSLLLKQYPNSPEAKKAKDL